VYTDKEELPSMIIFYYIILFIFGTAVGSFLGVVVDRTYGKESIWKGRSHCDHCRHNLGIFDLIPVFSFFLLSGKCRYCHKKLNWFYPLIEVCTGICYVAAGYTVYPQTVLLLSQTSYDLLMLYYFFMIGALTAIFFTDLRYGIIPFKVVVFAFLITILWDILIHFAHFPLFVTQLLGLQTNSINILGSAICAGGFFFLLFAATKGRGMGFGDVIYAFLMGFTLGFPRVLLGMYIAFVSGAVVSLILVVAKKRKLRGGTIPFGPFLVLGTIVSLLWGTAIIENVIRYLAY
jgi:leader peptidase (prepilin peptidase) / N-methyltransferase